MNEPTNPNNTQLVLPIVCPNCKHELNLGMTFELLPPEPVVEVPEPIVVADIPEEEEDEPEES